MIKTKHILMVSVAALMTACSSDELALTLPDGYDEINFTVGNGTANLTRTEGYLPYDYDRDPHSMSVFGWYNLSAENMVKPANTMFNNVEVTAGRDDESGLVSWTYVNKKYWFDYAAYSSFDFFGCMPYDASASLVSGAAVGNAQSYELSMDVKFAEGAAFSPVETALMCALPEHKRSAEGVIPFKMDQTLTGYTLVFQLGEQMDALRDFIVKEVKVYGNSLAHSGHVSRTYTYDGDEGVWSAGNITWTVTQDDYTDIPSTTDVVIPYKNNSNDVADLVPYYTDPVAQGDNTPARPGTMRVTNVPVQWGNAIYVIPVAGFNPTFQVKYDVVVQDEEGHDIITRHDVVSTIQFNPDFFKRLTKNAEESPVKMGYTRPINIKIVPDHLYVLADADQTFGYMPVSD